MSLKVLGSGLIRKRRKPPVDVVATVGYADAGGIPRNKDRFYFVRPMATRQVERGRAKGAAREFAPGFGAWNKDGSGGLAQLTATIHHARIEDAMSSSLTAYTAPRDIRSQRGFDAPPNQRPWCSSEDGETRTRWTGAEWETAPCTNEACPFLADGTCKPRIALTFTLTMDGYPTVKAFWESKSWNTMRHFKTWQDEVEAEWATMLEDAGLPQIPVRWSQMPIRLQVGEKSGRRGTGDWARWPEVQITTAIPLREFFMQIIDHQEEMRGRLERLVSSRASDIARQLEGESVTEMSGGKYLSEPNTVFDEDAEEEVTDAD